MRRGPSSVLRNIGSVTVGWWWSAAVPLEHDRAMRTASPANLLPVPTGPKEYAVPGCDAIGLSPEEIAHFKEVGTPLPDTLKNDRFATPLAVFSSCCTYYKMAIAAVC